MSHPITASAETIRPARRESSYLVTGRLWLWQLGFSCVLLVLATAAGYKDYRRNVAFTVLRSGGYVTSYVYKSDPLKHLLSLATGNDVIGGEVAQLRFPSADVLSPDILEMMKRQQRLISIEFDGGTIDCRLLEQLATLPQLLFLTFDKDCRFECRGCTIEIPQLLNLGLQNIPLRVEDIGALPVGRKVGWLRLTRCQLDSRTAAAIAERYPTLVQVDMTDSTLDAETVATFRRLLPERYISQSSCMVVADPYAKPPGDSSPRKPAP